MGQPHADSAGPLRQIAMRGFVCSRRNPVSLVDDQTLLGCVTVEHGSIRLHQDVSATRFGPGVRESRIGMSVAMKKYPLVAKWRYPVLAR